MPAQASGAGRSRRLPTGGAGWLWAPAPRLEPMYEGVVQDLIDELGRLPGVGPKSAQRIAFHLLQADPADVRRLAQVLVEVKDKVRFCRTCFNVAEDDQCRICLDPREGRGACPDARSGGRAGPSRGPPDTGQ